jgi:hypothetical protein
MRVRLLALVPFAIDVSPSCKVVRSLLTDEGWFPD